MINWDINIFTQFFTSFNLGNYSKGFYIFFLGKSKTE